MHRFWCSWFTCESSSIRTRALWWSYNRPFHWKMFVFNFCTQPRMRIIKPTFFRNVEQICAYINDGQPILKQNIQNEREKNVQEVPEQNLTLVDYVENMPRFLVC